MWPSLVIGSILRDLEHSDEFLNTITQDLPVGLKNTDFYQYETRTVLGHTYSMIRLDLVGLWKAMGHPIVDMDSTTRSWMRKGLVMKQDLHEAAEDINSMFKKDFCRQFYKRHNKWPTVSFDPDLNPHIVSCILENEWGETSSLKWDPKDFEHLQLRKNFEYINHVDTIDIISDKAIIPRSSEWIYEYDTKAFRTNHGRFPSGPSPTSKSVIIHFLVNESFDCKEIIGLIDKGVIPEEWKIMVAVPKEREFKQDDARCFGKMTFEMRAYQVITELNIAETIFTYIKHQSMTLSEEQLTKTLNRMSCPGGDHDYVNIVIDFFSWCTHFRAELVDPLFRSIDDLFGFSNVYSFTHKFPLISKLIFQDRYAPQTKLPMETQSKGPDVCTGRRRG